MDVPYEEEVSRLLEDLTEQREKVSGIVVEIDAVRESASSKNKVVKATVNGRGKVEEVVFRGDRWRDLSPKELGAAVVEAISDAQELAQEAVAGLASSVAPDGVDIADLFSAEPDIDKLFPDIERIWKSFNE